MTWAIETDGMTYARDGAGDIRTWDTSEEAERDNYQEAIDGLVVEFDYLYMMRTG